MNFFRKNFKDEKGQALAEYSLIISLIILAVFALVILFGKVLEDLYLRGIINKLPL